MFVRKLYASLILVALSVSAATPVWAASESGLTGNINGLIGIKTLDNDDWDPVEDQFLFGLQADFRRETWPVSVAVDVLASLASDEVGGVDVSGGTTEFATGVRKVFDNSTSLAPFIGGGLSVVRAHLKSETGFGGGTLSFQDNDTSVGFWAGGGVLFRLNEKMNLGLNVRYSKAEVNLFGVDVEAGGMSYGLLGGLRF